RSPWYSLPDHLCRFGVRAAVELARGFSRQHRITHFAAIGSASSLGHYCGGFTYHGPALLPRDNHRPGWATFLRHPIACLLPDRVPRSPATSPEGPAQVRVVSITGFSMVAPLPVREYQPVVHRLRLSASP